MPVSPDVAALLHRSYDAFNRRDISAVLATLHPDVDWPNMIDGIRIVGHDAVREYWMRQFEVIDPHVVPLQITEGPQGEIVVAVHQVVRDKETGEVISDQMVQHLHWLTEGLIAAMEVCRADGTLASAPRASSRDHTR